MSNKLFILSLLLAILPFAFLAPYKKTKMISRTDNWLPLGKFTGVASPMMRARMNIETGLKSPQLSDLTVVIFPSRNWPLVLNATNCSARLEQMSSQHVLRIPMDGSWSEWVKIDLPQNKMYVVISDCYGTYAQEITGRVTELEGDGLTFEPMTETDLRLPTEDAPSKKIESKELGNSFSYEFGLAPLSLLSFSILLLSLLITHIRYGKLCDKEFLFASPMLIVGVLFRTVMHLLLMAEAIVPSIYIFDVTLIVDLICQFGFTVHAISIALGYPLAAMTLVVINGGLTAMVFCGLIFTSDPFMILALRVVLLIILIVAFVHGGSQAAQAGALRIFTFIMGLIYLLGMLSIEVAFSIYSKVSSILLDRIGILAKAPTWPVMEWVIESDFLFQGCVMAVALIISAHISSKAQ